MELTHNETQAIEITERVASVLSLLGASIIIITFLCDKSFRKPINRLVFYAAWGNILTNVATIISTSGVTAPAALCQFQGFLIQWFMPADALWTFAMACNVYLTFFRKYDASMLRALEWRYCLFCYGVPFIPAFSYFFIHTESRGKVYGSAVLWCWVSIKWDFLRIAVFYGPVWLVILATLIIYVSCGRIIFKWRRQLLKFAQPQMSSGSIVKTTKSEVEVQEGPTSPREELPRYTATISVGHRRERSRVVSGEQRTTKTFERPLNRHPTADQNRVTSGANRAAINYCRTAILFFIALCVTWIPSTINRVYTLVHPDALLFGLNYASGLVLPLQGFWNAVIYISTSFPACKAFARRLFPCGRSSAMLGESQAHVVGIGGNHLPGKRHSMLLQAVGNIQRNNSRAQTTESEEELRGDDDE